MPDAKNGEVRGRRFSRREALRVGVSLTGVGLAGQGKGGEAEWPHYGGDLGSSKYSAVSQIDAGNFERLGVAWAWQSPDEAIGKANPELRTWAWESTPLMVGGVLYVCTSMSQVAAIDAGTGRTLWVHDPETWKKGTPSNNGFVQRGVAYWEKGKDRRILFGTGDGYLICLEAATGKPVRSFGQDGRIDLTQGLGRPVNRRWYGVSSPPVICRDVVVIGSKVQDAVRAKEMPPGDVRGFDVRTGKQKWLFRPIPREGEFGNETWEQESWRTTGAANVWTMMSADEALGYVYLPFSTPNNDWYGGERHGDGLFGESLVCLNARTGKRVWHFQMVHHGLWDYDLPAAPNLIDIRVDGKAVKAVAQVSKQGFVYVFDRVNGRPVWPIEERPAPQSTVPGEKSSRTQPFPTKPAPFDLQGVTENDLIDLTPELRREAEAVLRKYTYGPLYTPPSVDKPMIQMPGWAGGASWAGAAFDPETGVLYVASITNPLSITMAKPEPPSPAKYVGVPALMETLGGVPMWKPPWGRITAIDLNTGEHRWKVPMGHLDHPRLRGLGTGPLGRPTRGHALLTKTLLVVGQEGTTQRAEGASAVANWVTVDATLRAYDKSTGKLVGTVAIPRNATAAPMTYFWEGKQYIMVATGGANLPAELIALRVG